MIYNNPIVKGFYPDPSVCKVEDKYYLVCSSMQYFPGVPLFESEDLVNWKQIGHCLTRKSQIELDGVNSSGGVFAPTIRYNNGRFYMVTTNDTTRRNFYVWTDNIYGEWSEPICVEQDGIDPTLFFEDGKTYFLSNGHDDEGISGVIQSEIDIETGKKLSPSKAIWQGSGGRYLEGPHIYKLNGEYYLVAAEGGTEFGHMVTYARSKSIHGPYENYPNNPVLTNRNLGGYEIQGVGHGDLIQDKYGNWFIIHLGFRQMGQWVPFHHLGRETFLTPVTFNEDGWFSAGQDGTVIGSFEIQGDFIQTEKKSYTFENTQWNLDWCYIRHPQKENYIFGDGSLTLKGTDVTLDDVDSPTFIGIRQKDFVAEISCHIDVNNGEAGITFLMDENHHYDIAIRNTDNKYQVVKKLNIGDIKSTECVIDIEDIENTKLVICADNLYYNFYIESDGSRIELGKAQTKYLSSEVAGGFTGVIIGLYTVGNNSEAEFTQFKCEYL